jgi:HPt (histidine-containing phosphotransfer) domain-containing protein
LLLDSEFCNAEANPGSRQWLIAEKEESRQKSTGMVNQKGDFEKMLIFKMAPGKGGRPMASLKFLLLLLGLLLIVMLTPAWGDSKPEFGNACGRIRQCVAQGDMKTAIRVARSVKGSVETIGATFLSEASAELEQAAATKRQDLEVCAERFGTALRQALETISQLLGTEERIENGIVQFIDSEEMNG